jgi:DNA-binding response OmpR family regulator
MLLEDMLQDLGYEVVGPEARVSEALACVAGGDLDAAILDVNVHGELNYPIAEVLAARGIPFMFSTGYGDHVLPAEWKAHPVIGKPFMQADLEAALAALLSGR